MTSHGNLDGHPLNPLNHFLLEELRAGYKKKNKNLSTFFLQMLFWGTLVKSTSGDDEVKRDRFS